MRIRGVQEEWETKDSVGRASETNELSKNAAVAGNGVLLHLARALLQRSSSKAEGEEARCEARCGIELRVLDVCRGRGFAESGPVFGGQSVVIGECSVRAFYFRRAQKNTFSNGLDAHRDFVVRVL